MSHRKLTLHPGTPAYGPEADAAVSDFLGRSVHVLLGFDDFDDAERTRLVLHRAGLDGAVCLGSGLGSLWVLVVPVAEFRQARRALREASADVPSAADRAPQPSARRAPSMPDGGAAVEVGEGGPKPRRGYRNRGHQLHATLGALGVGDHHRYASRVLGRRVTSFRGISAEDFAAVLDTLTEARRAANGGRPAVQTRGAA